MAENSSFDTRFLEVKEKLSNLKNMTDEELMDFKKFAEDVEEEYKNFQLVVKRNCNSLYGVTANQFFSLHDTDVAEDITCTGKHFAIIVDIAINQFFMNWANEENLNKIREFYPNTTKLRNFTEYKRDTINDMCCYGDTDSRYVRLDYIYSLIIDENGKQMKVPSNNKEMADFSVFINKNFIANIIKVTIDKDCGERNARKGYLKMDHEVTTGKSIFLKKKKYIMTKIWEDDKFLGETKMKFQGVELKRGSMSEKAKKILSKLINKYLIDGYTNEQIRHECLKIIRYIKLKRDKELIYQISSVSGLDNMRKNDNGVWVSDKNHIQMQIALSWNNFIEHNDLKSLYRPAFEGQKMQFYYCEENSGYKVIGIPDDYNINDIKQLPEPDWNKMITQTLLKPLCNYILDKPTVDEKDVEAFLLGAKILNF